MRIWWRWQTNNSPFEVCAHSKLFHRIFRSHNLRSFPWRTLGLLCWMSDLLRMNLHLRFFFYGASRITWPTFKVRSVCYFLSRNVDHQFGLLIGRALITIIFLCARSFIVKVICGWWRWRGTWRKFNQSASNSQQTSTFLQFLLLFAPLIIQVSKATTSFMLLLINLLSWRFLTLSLLFQNQLKSLLVFWRYLAIFGIVWAPWGISNQSFLAAGQHINIVEKWAFICMLVGWRSQAYFPSARPSKKLSFVVGTSLNIGQLWLLLSSLFWRISILTSLIWGWTLPNEQSHKTTPLKQRRLRRLWILLVLQKGLCKEFLFCLGVWSFNSNTRFTLLTPQRLRSDTWLCQNSGPQRRWRGSVRVDKLDVFKGNSLRFGVTCHRFTRVCITLRTCFSHRFRSVIG